MKYWTCSVNLFLHRLPILETQRQFPLELQEAIASIIYAAPRCSDLPDLLQVKNLFTAKYGKEFISAVSQLRPDTSVNRTIIEKLSVNTPSGQIKLKLLKEIAREFDVNWDSSETEAEFNKQHNDLLDGPRPIHVDTALSALPTQQSSQYSSPSDGTNSVTPTIIGNSSMPDLHTSNRTIPLSQNSSKVIQSMDSRSHSSDILEKARVAIASAERASAAARAAAQLANINFGTLKREGGQS